MSLPKFRLLKQDARVWRRVMALPRTLCRAARPEKLATADEPQWKLLNYLSAAYRNDTGLEPGRESYNLLVVDAFIGLLTSDAIDQIKAFLTDKHYLFDRIREQHGQCCFFR